MRVKRCLGVMRLVDQKKKGVMRLTARAMIPVMMPVLTAVDM